MFGGQCAYLAEFYGKPGDRSFPDYSELEIITTDPHTGEKPWWV
ncbi:MAG: hypothetical protein AAFY16_01090 [Cyanobacteria bacterium J06642_3]